MAHHRTAALGHAERLTDSNNITRIHQHSGEHPRGHDVSLPADTGDDNVVGSFARDFFMLQPPFFNRLLRTDGITDAATRADDIVNHGLLFCPVPRQRRTAEILVHKRLQPQ